MHQIGLGTFDELRTLRDQTQPQERHFFVTVNASGIHIEKTWCPRWSTYGEALGFDSG
jgi:hypothetical protein